MIDVSLSDTISVTDDLQREHDAHREIADAIAVTDAIGFRVNPDVAPPLLFLVDPDALATLLTPNRNDLITLLLRQEQAAKGPNDIITSGLTFHLDASQGGLSTDGGGITTWPDLSPTGADAVSGLTAGQPQLVAKGMNGLDAVRFTSANAESLSSDTPWITQAPFTFLAVVQVPGGGGTFQVLMSMDETGNPAAYFFVVLQDLANGLAALGVQLGGESRVDTPAIMSLNVPQIVTCIADNATNRRAALNGSAFNTVAVLKNLNTVGGYALGVLRRTFPVLHVNALVGEVCGWNRALTAEELLRERRRLDAKWGANFAPFTSGRIKNVLVAP